MRLSERLAAVAACVSQGSVLCDVGCDHGYLPIALVLEGSIPKALSMDINEGPLKNAEANIASYGLSDRIRTRLSDGLEAMMPHEADTICISGMGGRLIRRIISDNIEKAMSAKEWVFEPQSDVGSVREFLFDTGVAIVDEDMVKERGSYYPVIKVDTTRVFDEIDSGLLPEDRACYIEFGPILLRNRHPLLIEYLTKESDRIYSIINSKPGPDTKRISELEDRLQLVSRAIEIVGR